VSTETTKLRSYYKMLLKDYPDVLNVMEMCAALGGLSKKTGYKLMNNGTIPSVKVGRSHRILKVNIIEYLTNCNK